VQGFVDVQGDGRADQSHQHERRHGQAQRRRGPFGHLDRRALVHGAHDLGEQPQQDAVDHERGRVLLVTDSEDVLLASTHSGETTASTSAKTFCLTPISSKTASMTKSASANASLVSEPDTSS
jgi:hypothetical protein